MTAAAGREAATCLVDKYPVSDRSAWRTLDVHRTAIRYKPRRGDGGAIRARLCVLPEERPRWGYRVLHELLRREGFRVNHQRFCRLGVRPAWQAQPERLRGGLHRPGESHCLNLRWFICGSLLAQPGQLTPIVFLRIFLKNDASRTAASSLSATKHETITIRRICLDTAGACRHPRRRAAHELRPGVATCAKPRIHCSQHIGPRDRVRLWAAGQPAQT